MSSCLDPAIQIELKMDEIGDLKVGADLVDEKMVVGQVTKIKKDSEKNEYIVGLDLQSENGYFNDSKFKLKRSLFSEKDRISIKNGQSNEKIKSGDVFIVERIPSIKDAINLNTEGFEEMMEDLFEDSTLINNLEELAKDIENLNIEID